MPLSEEIKQAAENLGIYLADEPCVHEFIATKVAISADVDLTGKENQLADLLDRLAKRQHSGEVLSYADITEYSRLRSEVQSNPLIAARDEQLENVNNLFARTAQELTAVLKIDYITLVD